MSYIPRSAKFDPKETRPFNAQYARSGAPYRTTEGDQVTLLIYQVPLGSNLQCVTGCVGNPHLKENICQIGIWDSSTGLPLEISPCKEGLIMVPLGTLYDKPVYWGDRLWNRALSQEVVVASDFNRPKYFASLVWPEDKDNFNKGEFCIPRCTIPYTAVSGLGTVTAIEMTTKHLLTTDRPTVIKWLVDNFESELLAGLQMKQREQLS